MDETSSFIKHLNYGQAKPAMLAHAIDVQWFSHITTAHAKACNALNDAFLDVTSPTKGFKGDGFPGIADERGAGPFRIFKREEDQTQKKNQYSGSTTREDILAAMDWTISELEQAGVDRKMIETLSEIRNRYRVEPSKQ